MLERTDYTTYADETNAALYDNYKAGPFVKQQPPAEIITRQNIITSIPGYEYIATLRTVTPGGVHHTSVYGPTAAIATKRLIAYLEAK